MISPLNRATPAKVWIGIFCLWGLFLSGWMAGFIGSPGILQAARLNHLLSAKQDQVDELQETIHRLETESVLLEKNRLVQQREIRRVLGYAAPDELIFDFSSQEKL
jgi:cell division protein FtsB